MDLLYTILLTEADTPPSKDPNKIRIKNKESGAAYYIDRHNFDPNIHTKADVKKSMPSKEKSSGDKKKSSGGGGGKFSLGGDAAKDLEKSSAGKDDAKEKKDPDKELQTKIGSPVFVPKQQREKVQADAEDMRPDLKEKLLSFELSPLVSEYNKLKLAGGDPEDIKTVAMKIQKIAIAKFAALATMENDPVTVNYAKIYKAYAPNVNDMLRSNDHIMDKAELEDEMKEKGVPNELSVLLNINYSIHIVDEHFSTPGAVLPNDVTVYRAIDNSVLDVFLKAKKWIDNAFVSTSVNPLIADSISSGEDGKTFSLIKMKLKRGDRVLMLSCKEDFYCIESEIILPRGCAFTIDDVTDGKGTNIYNVTVEFPNGR